MLTKDIPNLNENKNFSNKDIYEKSSLHLFSLSHLKSKKIHTISFCNSFNYNFNRRDNFEIKDKCNNSNIVNNRKITLIDGDNISSLKTLNIDVPSPKKLLEKKFQNEFMEEYENSFAHFCGINKQQFRDLYINNHYIPVLSELGDISISIKSILQLLKTYSFTLKLKITRRLVKKYRVNKIFKTQKKKTKNKKRNDLINENINSIFLKSNDLQIEENNNNIIPVDENNNYLNKRIAINNINNNIPKNNKFLNLKKKLNLSIQKNEELNENFLQNSDTILNKYNFNKKNHNNYLSYNFINNEKMENVLSNNMKPPLNYNKQGNLSTPNNNIFNFSTNVIQNYFNFQNPSAHKNMNEYLNKKRANTPGFKNNLNNNINNNLLNILSPNIISPYIDFLSPNSHYFSQSNISSPNLFLYSPFYNNNLYTDNRNSAFFFGNNSPIVINSNYNSSFNNFSNMNTNNKSDNNNINNKIIDSSNNKNLNNQINININNSNNNIHSSLSSRINKN